MTLLYIKEHINCYNYEGNNSAGIVEVNEFSENQKWNFNTIKNEFIYVRQGSLSFSYGKYKNELLPSNHILIIPAGNTVKAIATEASTVYSLRLAGISNLCECFSLDMLLGEDRTPNNEKLSSLEMSTKLISFFDMWSITLADGLLCKYYLELKTKEFFYLLRAYHTKDDLLDFFNPLLSNDMTFSDFIIRNHFKAKSVQDLANMANYSLSGFQKRFKKVFGVSAYNWMKEEKMKAIFHSINNSSKTFKEISDEYDFSSPSHFNDFCKTNFGHTPGILRKKKINVRILKE